MGRVCVPSCRCCVCVSVVHPVAILNAVFYVICSLLMFVSDASGLLQFVSDVIGDVHGQLEESLCFNSFL